MSFPQSRILSPSVPTTQTVKQETNVNVNISDRSAEVLDVQPVYPPPTPYSDDSLKALQDTNTKLLSSINFLKGIINLISSVQLRLGNSIVASQSELEVLIRSLIPEAKEVQINLDDDFNSACCANGRYGKISSILVSVDDQLRNIKYFYPDAFSTLQAYSISTKFLRF